MTPDARAALDAAHHEAVAYLEALDRRPVGATATPDELAERFDRTLPDQPLDPAIVVHDLAAAVDPGLVAGSGPRYFGFVTGGTEPGAMAADWLTSAWDQNTALWAMSPGAITVQNLASSWLYDLPIIFCIRCEYH